MSGIRSVAAFATMLVFTACASAGTSSPGSTAGATSKSGDAAAISNAINVASAPYVGSRKSKRYYPSACNTVKLIALADQIGFGSQKDAEAAGFAKDLYSTDCSY